MTESGDNGGHFNSSQQKCLRLVLVLIIFSRIVAVIEKGSERLLEFFLS